MRAILLKNLKIHSLIFTGLITFMLLFIFISSQFNTLHPDAYQDGIMSIVYVYSIIIIVLIPIEIVRAKVDPEKLASNQLFKWHFHNGLLTHIALMFALITIVNSIMMITGIDTPKTGLFAYTHLFIRLGIVSASGLLWMGSSFLMNRKQESPKVPWKPSLKNIKDKMIQFPVIYSFNTFTLATIIILTIMHFLSLFISITGGFNLYFSLIILYFIVLISHLIFSKAHT